MFERLFALLTNPGSPPRSALIAFDLTNYVCARLLPDVTQAKAWLEKLIRLLLDGGVRPERRGDVAAAVLTLLAMAPGPGTYRWARGCLLRLGIDPSGPPPAADGIQGFVEVLKPRTAFSDLWPHLSALRTYQEQVRSYLLALEDGRPAAVDYPDLRDGCEEWPILEGAFTSEHARRRIAVIGHAPDVCPRCNIRLPRGEAFKLRSTGVATAKGCCSRVLIWPGP